MEEAAHAKQNLIMIIFPRMKKGVPPPVDVVAIDKQKVESLFHLPVKTAAEKLGLCVTSLKRVCRDLGIDKWPYEKTTTSPRLRACSLAPSGSAAPCFSMPQCEFEAVEDASERRMCALNVSRGSQIRMPAVSEAWSTSLGSHRLPAAEEGKEGATQPAVDSLPMGARLASAQHSWQGVSEVVGNGLMAIAHRPEASSLSFVMCDDLRVDPSFTLSFMAESSEDELWTW
jgi:hypothetical protein